MDISIPQREIGKRKVITGLKDVQTVRQTLRNFRLKNNSLWLDALPSRSTGEKVLPFSPTEVVVLPSQLYLAGIVSPDHLVAGTDLDRGNLA